MKLFGRTIVKSKVIVENLDDKLKAEKTFKLQDRIYFKGLDIAVENKKGSIRRGVNDDGTKWETFMHIPYGYIRRTESVSDGEKIDCYIGENKDSEKVFIVNQNNPYTGKFDEQKCMLGFDTAEEAKKAYLKQYDNPKFFGSIKEMSFDEFKKKALSTEDKPKLLKAFGLMLKAFGTQLGMFDGVIEGQTKQKDGHTYEVRRSKKNPLVKRLFRADKEESKPKELSLFDQKVRVGSRQSAVGRKLQVESGKSKEDLLWEELESIKQARIDRPRKNDWDRQKKMLRIQDEIIKLGNDKKGGGNDHLGLSNYKDDLTMDNTPIAPEVLAGNVLSGYYDRKEPDYEEIEDLFNQPQEPKKETPKPKEPKAEIKAVKGKKNRKEINSKVEELLKTKKNEEMSAEDIELLAQYTGRGGLLGDTLEDISLNEFYTRKDEAEFIWDMIGKLGFKGGNVLEPSCFIKGTNIITEKGIKTIENIEIGDMVLTHRTIFQKVYNTTIKKTKEIVEIEIPNSPTTIQTTREHPFYAVKVPKCSIKHRPCHVGHSSNDEKCEKRWQEYTPQWIPVGELNQGDYIIDVFDKTEERKEFIELEIKNLLNSKTPERIAITEELLKIIGLYISQGCSDGNCVIFTIHEDRKELHDLIINYFNGLGIKATLKIKKNNKSIEIRVNSSPLARLLLENIGRLSFNKSIPGWLMKLSINQQKHLIWGLANGDGHIDKKNFFSYDTTSKNLAEQIKRIFYRQSIVPSYRTTKIKKGKKFINGREVISKHEMYHVIVAGFYFEKFLEIIYNQKNEKRAKSSSRTGFVRGNYAYIKLQKIRIKEVEETEVYNFSVESDESYCIQGATVHNCGTGIFVETAPEKALVTGIEIEETSGRIGQILHGNEHDIRIQSFEQFIKDYDNMGADLEGGEYDAIVGNCPFGKRGLSAMDDREKSDIKFHEQYFIDRGLDMLKPGGIMAMIVPTSIMDNQLNQWRGEINKKGEFLGAIRVPTGAFKHTDAQVTTDIVFFKKRPPEVIEHLNKLSKEELGEAYDDMVLDADFVSGNFFKNNSEYALGTETSGMFGMKIWKGDVTKADLEKVGELLNHEARDYNSLGIDVGKYGELEKELEPGDVKILNGRTYILNKNHRWERLKDQEVVLQNLPEDIKKLGIKSWDEWRIKSEDTAYLYGLNKDQLKLFGQTRIVNELDGYNGKSDFQTEYLTKGVILGLAVKDFRKELQDGRLSAEEAQIEAGKLKILLKDFIEKYGHPIDNLKLNKFFRNSGNTPLLDLAGSYDKNGNTIKMFDDPLSFYKVYQTKSEIGTVDRNDIVSVISFLFANNFPTDYQTVRGEYEGDGDIERELAYSDEIYFDEEGNYKPKEEVLYGYIYEKIDAWEKQRTELKKEAKNDKLSDKEKELNTQKMRKLEDQIIEAKTRANIREIKQLPIMLSDAGSIYDIGILNKYLEEKIGAHFLGELRKDEKSGFILPVDQSSANLYLSYADITKEGKSTEVKKDLRNLFNKDEHPLLFMILNKMNGLGLPALRTEGGIAKKEQVLQLETDFKQYLSDSEEADKIADTYNRLFNSYIQKTYDETPIEGIKHFAYDRVVGKDASGKDITGRDKAGGHTWATVRRMYEQGKGMIAHGVGLGKTLEALILVLLSKETGRVSKPSIVAPKSVLLNWVAEIEKWTQGVNYLLVGYRKDSTGAWIEETREEKELKLQRAANEEFDMILMSRDLFGTIDFSPGTKKNMLNELMDKYYPEGNRLSTFSDKNSKHAKNVKKKRDTLLRNLSSMMNIPGPLGGIYLDNIGIDLLVRDEAHDTKNLLVPMENEISGVNSSTSQRAMHNLFASKIIRGQNNDMGYFALTATPISNSPLEVFNMMVPFAEKELEKLNVQNMDDFIGRFADIDNIPTTNADGRVFVKNKFAGWKSAEALRNTFFRFVDYKTKDDVESVKANIKFPKEKAGNVLSDLNEGQRELVKHCKLRLWALSSRKFDKDSGELVFDADKLQEKVANGLISQNEANEVLDYYENEYLPTFNALNGNRNEDEPPNDDHFFKVQQDLIKATSDLPWYKDKHSEYSKEVDDSFVSQHSDLKKFAQLNENALSIHNSGGKQIIFAINTALHDKIKRDLVKSGIPENEIVIVNGKTVSSSSKRLQISKAYNDGKYKVVIGNYATMGEGLNFNYMTSDIHHLQPAWNHLQIEQGNGRGIRQGNPLDSVNTHYYLTKGSIDGFMNTKIMDKAGMVDKFLKGETSRWDDEVQLEADEMMIELADNPEQAKALLAFRNKKLQDALAEQQRQSNYKQLDRLYEVKRKMAGIEEKTSKKFQMMQQEERSLTEKLIEADFEHKGKLDLNRTPVILPGINKVVPIGSILGGSDGEFYVVEDYAPSTQRVKIRTYKAGTQGDMVATRAISAKDLDKEFPALYKETDLDLGGMFNKIIEDNDEVGLNFVAKIPKEILQANKVKLLEKLKESDEVLYQTMDGNYNVADYEDAKIEMATEGGKIIFPQEKVEFSKILNELIKQNKPRQQYGQEYSRFRRFKNLAVSIYGENYENAIKKEIKRLNGEATETSVAIHTTGAQYKKELMHLYDKGYLSDWNYKQITQGKAWDEMSMFNNALRAEFLDVYNIKDDYGEYRINPSLITPEMLDRARAIDEIKSDDNKDLLEDILTNKMRGVAA